MLTSYIYLGIAALFPVIASGVFYLLEKRTRFSSLPYFVRQLIIGLVFGGIAVIGTEWGIPVPGAVVNCRDAAPLCAGLLFGGPAGIIAGLVGGVERWFAVAWGVGSFTRVACSVSTVVAGLYAAALRKFMFDDKKPGIILALAIGFVMEVFHLTMVFLTNLGSAEQAARVVMVCTGPMVIANSVSVMLATTLLSLISRDLRRGRPHRVHISQTIQRRLLLCVLVAFLATSAFTYFLQNGMADEESRNLLSLSIQGVQADIQDASDEYMLAITRGIAEEYESVDLPVLATWYSVREINIVNSTGIITKSTVPTYIGYDMASGEQSAQFLVLLHGQKELVQDYTPISFNSAVSRKYAGVAVDGGFVQVGYDGDQFQNALRVQVTNISKNRRVGKTGFIVIASETGRIVSAPEALGFTTLKQAGLTADGVQPGKVFSVSIEGESYLCMYEMTEGYRIVGLYPRTESLRNRNVVLFVNAFMEVLAFAAMFAMIYLLIKRVVVDNIREVNSTLDRITGGDLDATVNVRSNAEFASLSDDINSTVSTLKRYIAEAAARIDKELEFAQNIQASALPSVFPAFPLRKDFDIYATMDPAKEVGGDFYDFYLSGTDHLYFLIADVSGKGIPAAMFMMRAKTQLKSLAETGMPLNEVFTVGNADLCEGNDAGMFVTSWMGDLDLRTGHMTYVNAGHNFPLLRRADGQFDFEKCRPGFVLAGMDGVKYRLNELDLRPGDTLFLYTDGVTEATNAGGELFGDARLLNAANALPVTDMGDLCRGIKTAVESFVAEAPQFDDITMLALRFIGTEPAPELRFDNASLDDIPVITEFLENELAKLDCPMKAVVQLSIALDEIYSNICKYAYDGKSGPAAVRLETAADHRSVTLVFTDSGIPYNPVKKEDPDVTQSIDERPIGGLGIFMVKKSMDDMIYEYRSEQNILKLVKKF